jgi:hypothetical protein
MLRKNTEYLRRELDWLKAKHMINGEIHRDYMLLILGANTPEQLDEISYDLAEICRSMYRPVSFR